MPQFDKKDENCIANGCLHVLHLLLRIAGPEEDANKRLKSDKNGSNTGQ
jgi:hypothetical protein